METLVRPRERTPAPGKVDECVIVFVCFGSESAYIRRQLSSAVPGLTGVGRESGSGTGFGIGAVSVTLV